MLQTGGRWAGAEWLLAKTPFGDVCLSSASLAQQEAAAVS
jgi:hypothetical protein